MPQLTSAQIAGAALAAVLLLVAIRFFFPSLRVLFKGLLSAAAGLVGLLAFNLLGSAISVTLGLNIANILVVGFLGLPGLATLLMINWVLI